MIGLATEGGFSVGAVEPPEDQPPSPPAGFEVGREERTPTYTLFRYRAARRHRCRCRARRLRLTDMQPGFLLQRPRPPSTARASIAPVSTSKIEAPSAASAARPSVEPRARSGRTFVIKPASRVAAPRHQRALALPRAPPDARLARHRRPLQADVPRRRVGDPRPRLHCDRLHHRLRQVRELPGRRVPYPSLVIAGVLPMQYFASSLTGRA